MQYILCVKPSCTVVPCTSCRIITVKSVFSFPNRVVTIILSLVIMRLFILYPTILCLWSGISSLMSLINIYYISDNFDVEMAFSMLYMH